MTVEITQEMVDVSQEFAMSKYASHQAIWEAMLQEIVDLRKKVAEISSDFEQYMEQY